jgi:hypothetical protein
MVALFFYFGPFTWALTIQEASILTGLICRGNWTTASIPSHFATFGLSWFSTHFPDARLGGIFQTFLLDPTGASRLR